MKEIQKEPNERFWRINEICKLIAKTPLSTTKSSINIHQKRSIYS
ncbi:MAG: hypothetical protein SO164_01950 [Campylobacter sp.]|nr:hypothetical protein [Campylobacter sp.]